MLGSAVGLVDIAYVERCCAGRMSPSAEEVPRRVQADVARRGDLTLVEVAHGFDMSVESVRRWMRQTDIDDGIKYGLTSSGQAELVKWSVAAVHAPESWRERFGARSRCSGSDR